MFGNNDRLRIRAVTVCVEDGVFSWYGTHRGLCVVGRVDL